MGQLQFNVLSLVMKGVSKVFKMIFQMLLSGEYSSHSNIWNAILNLFLKHPILYFSAPSMLYYKN
jgi:hypothetical protein